MRSESVSDAVEVRQEQKVVGRFIKRPHRTPTRSVSEDNSESSLTLHKKVGRDPLDIVVFVSFFVA